MRLATQYQLCFTVVLLTVVAATGHAASSKQYIQQQLALKDATNLLQVVNDYNTVMHSAAGDLALYVTDMAKAKIYLQTEENVYNLRGDLVTVDEADELNNEFDSASTLCEQNITTAQLSFEKSVAEVRSALALHAQIIADPAYSKDFMESGRCLDTSTIKGSYIDIAADELNYFVPRD